MTKTKIGTATVSSGKGSTQYTIPSDANIGENTLEGVYQQNNTYETATGTSTLHIRVPTTINVSNVLASIGETATFTAQVKHHTSQNVTEGTATLDVDLDLDAGTYNIQAVYEENDNYQYATGSGILTVESKEYTLDDLEEGVLYPCAVYDGKAYLQFKHANSILVLDNQSDFVNDSRYNVYYLKGVNSTRCSIGSCSSLAYGNVFRFRERCINSSANDIYNYHTGELIFSDVPVSNLTTTTLSTGE